MEEQGLLLSKDSLYSLLQGCIRTKDLACGRRLHSHLIFNGLGTPPHFGDHLIRLFASCGKLLEASLVFHKIMDPSVYSWNAIISAHAQFGEAKGALRLFYDMEEKHNVSPDQVTLLCILKAFKDSRTALEQVRLIHNWVIHGGLEADVALGSTFVDVYAKCGSMDEAHKVFNRLLNRNVVSWGAMISVCAQHKQDRFALQLFEKMQQEGIKPGRVVFLGTLKACGHTRAIDQGRLIHHQIINSGLQSEQSIGNSLIDMYAKCKSLEEARMIFDTMQSRDVVSWSAMLSGYVENGYSSSALNLFGQGQREGIEPDKVMFLCILKACSSTGSIDKGIMLHKQIHCSGLESDVVIGNALVDMYAKCGSVENARAVFDKMPVRQMVSWGAMISGYAQLGYGIFALELFKEMQRQGIEPNDVVFLGALKACSSIGSIRQGRLIHEHLVRSKLESDLVVGNAVIDMYVKSGSLEEANRLFKKMSIRDVVSWGGMITGYVQCGYYEVAGHYLEEMVAEGVKPDDQIFTTLLTACSHGGLVEEGRHYFKLMRLCGITPGVAHYNCMIDLLSRAGRLSEAENLLQSMPDCPDAVGWMSLLTNCRTYGHKQLGKKSYREVMQADPRYASSYTLISNIYANAYMWEHASKTEDLRLCKGVMKKPGRAWIEVGNKAYEFIVGEQSHPQSDDIFTALRRLGRPMKKEGYLPQSDLSQETVIYKVQALAFAAPICHLGP